MQVEEFLSLYLKVSVACPEGNNFIFFLIFIFSHFRKVEGNIFSAFRQPNHHGRFFLSGVSCVCCPGNPH